MQVLYVYNYNDDIETTLQRFSNSIKSLKNQDVEFCCCNRCE